METNQVWISLPFFFLSLFSSSPLCWISQIVLKVRITKFILYHIRNISALVVKYIWKVLANDGSRGLACYPKAGKHASDAKDTLKTTQHLGKTISELPPY